MWPYAVSFTTQPSADGSSAVTDDSIGHRLLPGVVDDGVGALPGGASASPLAVDEILGSAAILAKAKTTLRCLRRRSGQHLGAPDADLVAAV